MDCMSNAPARSAYPFFPCASLSVACSIRLAKRPLPFTCAETGCLLLLTLLPLGHTSCFGVGSYGLIQVLSCLLPCLLSSEYNILGLPSPSCPCLFPGDPFLLRKSRSPVRMFSYFLPHFHRKAPPTEVPHSLCRPPKQTVATRLPDRCCILRAWSSTCHPVDQQYSPVQLTKGPKETRVATARLNEKWLWDNYPEQEESHCVSHFLKPSY